MQEIMTPKERHSGLIFPAIIVLLLMLASGFFLVYRGNIAGSMSSTSGLPAVVLDEVPEATSPMEGTAADPYPMDDTVDSMDEELIPLELVEDVFVDLDAEIEYVENDVENDNFTDLEL